jgi:hypothetical protein
MPSNTLGAFTSLMGASAAGSATGEALGQAVTGGAAGPLGGLLGPLAGLGSGGGAAAAIGPLSVPPSWAAVTSPTSPLASSLGSTPLAASAAGGIPLVPGMPMASTAGGHSGGATPKYGFRPTVVTRPLAAG